MAARKVAHRRDPRSHIAGLTAEETGDLKIIILSERAMGNKRADICLGLSLSMVELQVLLADDPEFRKAFDEVVEADDADLADIARAVIHNTMLTGSERAKLTAALHVDRTRGGYGEKKTIDVRKFEPNVDPVDLNSHKGVLGTIGAPRPPMAGVAEDEAQDIEGW